MREANTINEIVKDTEKKGWILIGELECGEKNPLPTSDNEPYFMYARYCDEKGYCYSITKSFTKIAHFDYFYLPKRYSINTILCSYISFDRDYGKLPCNKRLMTLADGFKIRLAGYKDWIEVDDEFLNGKINMDELELKFRTDKETIWLKQCRESNMNKDKESQKLLKNYKIIT